MSDNQLNLTYDSGGTVVSKNCLLPTVQMVIITNASDNLGLPVNVALYCATGLANTLLQRMYHEKKELDRCFFVGVSE